MIQSGGEEVVPRRVLIGRIKICNAGKKVRYRQAIVKGLLRVIFSEKWNSGGSEAGRQLVPSVPRQSMRETTMVDVFGH